MKRQRGDSDGLSGAGDRVRLNVGGRLYECTRATLCKHEGVLKGAFEHGSCVAATNSADEPFFIDRDPDAFAAVLAFMRQPPDANGTIPEIVLAPASPIGMAQVREELQFFFGYTPNDVRVDRETQHVVVELFEEDGAILDIVDGMNKSRAQLEAVKDAVTDGLRNIVGAIEVFPPTDTQMVADAIDSATNYLQ
jgi:hypothetical protein